MMEGRIGFRDVLLLVFVAFVWGFNFVMISVGLEDFPPLLFNALRFAVIIPCLFFVPKPDVPWSKLISLGFIFGVMLFGLLFFGMHAGMPAGLASLVMQMQVFFTILLGVVLLGERPIFLRWLAMLFGFFSIFIIGHNMVDGTTSDTRMLAFLIVIGAAFCWGISNIMLKQMGSVNMLSVMVWLSVVPPVPLYILSVLMDGQTMINRALMNISWIGVIAVIYTGLISTTLAYSIWGSMLKRYSTVVVTPFALLVPVFGFLMAAIFLGEEYNLIQSIAAILTILSLTLNLIAPWLQEKYSIGKK